MSASPLTQSLLENEGLQPSKPAPVVGEVWADYADDISTTIEAVTSDSVVLTGGDDWPMDSFLDQFYRLRPASGGNSRPV